MSDINILLLGENGVGKTTFINAFINYCYFNNMEEARSSGLIIGAPMSFSVLDKNNKSRNFELGEKEHTSATSQVKNFYVSVGERQMRLVDTPGFFTDESNLDDILSQICPLQELHGVCIFVKSTLTRCSESLEYCIRQIIAKLDVPIVNNIIFVITHTRSVSFHPTVAKSVLQGVLDSISSKLPHLNIAFTKKNTFCVENESFLNLAAETNGVKLHSREVDFSKESWKISQKECQRLISYVQNIKPYKFPQFEIVTEIEEFFENNISNLCALAESGFICMERCHKMQKNAKVAAELLEKIKHKLEERSSNSEPKTFADTVGSSYSPSNMKTLFKTLVDYLSHLIPLFQVKGDRQYKNPNKSKKSSFKHNNKKAKIEAPTRAMSPTSDDYLMDNLNQLTRLVKEQEIFVQRTHEMYTAQLKKIESLLGEGFRFSTYLVQNKKKDVLTEQMTQLLSTLRERQDSESTEVCEKMQKMIEKNKAEVQAQTEIEVSSKDVKNLLKNLEKIQHYQEVYNTLFEFN